MPRKTDALAERRTVVLSPVRLKPSEMNSLKADAQRRGYLKKFSEYIRLKLLSGKIADEEKGMPVDDVMRNLSDIARIRQCVTWEQALLHLDKIHQRHMAVIRPDTHQTP